MRSFVGGLLRFPLRRRSRKSADALVRNIRLEYCAMEYGSSSMAIFHPVPCRPCCAKLAEFPAAKIDLWRLCIVRVQHVWRDPNRGQAPTGPPGGAPAAPCAPEGGSRAAQTCRHSSNGPSATWLPECGSPRAGERQPFSLAGFRRLLRRLQRISVTASCRDGRLALP